MLFLVSSVLLLSDFQFDIAYRCIPSWYHCTEGGRSRHCFDGEAGRYGLHHISAFGMFILRLPCLVIHALQYFTLSGLNTNLGLLDNGRSSKMLCFCLLFLHNFAGITWAFTIAIACLAFLGKFGGCTIASRLSGFSWRESSTIGALMSCKG